MSNAKLTMSDLSDREKDLLDAYRICKERRPELADAFMQFMRSAPNVPVEDWPGIQAEIAAASPDGKPAAFLAIADRYLNPANDAEEMDLTISGDSLEKLNHIAGLWGCSREEAASRIVKEEAARRLREMEESL